MADKNEIKLKLTIDGKQAEIAIDNTNEGFNGLISKIREVANASKSTSERMDEHFNRIRHVVQGVREAYNAVKTLFAKPIELAVSREQAVTSFTVLLKSAELAQNRIQELTDFAAHTPFELPNVINASRTLETLTHGALSTGDGLRLVGDVAAGVGVDINELSMWFGRLYDGIQSGRPVGEALMRMQELGIISGETRGKLEDLGKAGKLQSQGWAVVTQELSKFNGMMEKQSQTLGGKLSNMSDSITEMLTTVGGSIAVMLTPVITHITNLVNSLNTLSPAISGSIGAIGMLTSAFVVLKVTGIGAVISDFLKLPGVFNAVKFSSLISGLNITSLSFRTAAMSAKAFLSSIGPIGWTIIAVTTAVEAFNLLSSSVDSAGNSISEAEKDLRVQQKQLEELTQKVGDSNKSMEERKKALENIQKINPDYLKNVDLEKTKYSDLATELKKVNDEFEKSINLKVLENKMTQALSNKVDLEYQLKNATPESSRNQISAFMRSIFNGGDYNANAIQSYSQEIQNLANQYIEADKQYKQFKSQLDSLGKTTKTTTEPPEPPTPKEQKPLDWSLSRKDTSIETANKEAINKIAELQNKVIEDEYQKKMDSIFNTFYAERENINNSAANQNLKTEQIKALKAATLSELSNLQKDNDEKTNKENAKNQQSEIDFLFQKRDMEIELMGEGQEKETAILNLKYDRMRNEIESTYANEADRKNELLSITERMRDKEITSLANQGNLSVQLANDFRSAWNSAGNAVSSALGNAVRLFRQANSLLQIFLNSLISATIQMAAMRVVTKLFDFLPFSKGGAVPATPANKEMATGGYITGPGGPTDDKIPALLSNGEYVINAEATKRNKFLLDVINGNNRLPVFATGGYVQHVSNMAEISRSINSIVTVKLEPVELRQHGQDLIGAIKHYNNNKANYR